MPKSLINGARIFWELSGDSGEPVVLVHGSWVDHHRWDAVVPPLSRSFRVLTYDRRGHSQSERPQTPYRLSVEVDDLAGLIEEIRLAPTHVVGQSSGASIALRLAAERPELIRSLIVNEPPLMALLADSASGQEMLKSIKAKFAVVVKLLEAGEMEEAARQFVETIAFGPGGWEQLPLALKKIAIANAPSFLDEMHDHEFFSFDLTRVRGFDRPALVTHGEVSPPPFRIIAAKLADALPHAHRKTFPAAGHEPEQSNPEAYTTALTDFIAEVRRETRSKRVAV